MNNCVYYVNNNDSNNQSKFDYLFLLYIFESQANTINTNLSRNILSVTPLKQNEEDLDQLHTGGLNILRNTENVVANKTTFRRGERS